MSSAPVSSLVAAATPPMDCRFHSGTWFTHDLDHIGLTLGVGPALAGCESPDPRRRLNSTRTIAADLLVVANWGRIEARPPTRRIQVCVGPTGRVQHAKFALLRFDRPSGVPIIRALVTSANLTAGGLGRNLELLVVEDSNGSGALAKSLRHALRSYAELPGLPGVTKQRIKAILRSIGIPDDKSPSLTIHSFGGDVTVVGQLARYPSTASATSLTLVDPGFARSGHAKLARELRSVFPKVTSIRVIGQESPQGEFMFSRELRNAIADKFEIEPTLHVITGDRNLHAKAIAWRGPSGSATLVGSANLTVPGLLGRNLELGVVVDGTSLIKELPTRRYSAFANLEGRQDESELSLPPMLATGRVEAQDKTRRLLTARIDIELLGRQPDWPTWTVEDIAGNRTGFSRWRHSGARRFVCKDLSATIDEDNWQVWFRTGKATCVVPVELEGYLPPDFEDLRDADDPIPPLLVALVTQVQSRIRSHAASEKQTTDRPADVLSKDDPSLIHILAKAIRHGRGSLSEEQIVESLEVLENSGRLTSGERWALCLMVMAPNRHRDPRGHRLAKTIQELL